MGCLFLLSPEEFRIYEICDSSKKKFNEWIDKFFVVEPVYKPLKPALKFTLLALLSTQCLKKKLTLSNVSLNTEDYKLYCGYLDINHTWNNIWEYIMKCS